MSLGRSSLDEEVKSQAERVSREQSRMMNEGRSFSSHERHCCFLNSGAAFAAGGRFANISAVSGLDFPDDGRAVALVDWDQDGDQDLWISNRNAPRLRLMRNDLNGRNHFLSLHLQGDGTTANRDAVGARVEVVLDGARGQGPGARKVESGARLIKTVRAGEGFLAQSSKWLHYGLGEAQGVEKVLVHWPGGSLEEFAGIQLDRRYRLVQGSGASRVPPRRVSPGQLVAAPQVVPIESTAARIPMVELLSVPDSGYTDAAGMTQSLAPRSGGALLVNLWSDSCAPCRKELNEFSRRYDELKAAGIGILALSIDGLGKGQAGGELAQKTVVQFDRKYPFPFGVASEELVQDFQILHDLQFALHPPLPLPCSFLLDIRGRLAVIYKGPVAVDELLTDVAHSQRSRAQRILHAAPVAGRSIPHRRVEEEAKDWAVSLRFIYAQHLQLAGRTHQAIRQYSDVLNVRHETVEAHNNLGTLLQALGRPAEAMEHYKTALEINPQFAEAHTNLGNALVELGKPAEALAHFETALAIHSDLAEAQTSWGNALQVMGRNQEALTHYAQATRIKPEYAEAYYNWGIALHALGRSQEAIAQYQRAIQVRPDYAEAHHNLGVMFASGQRFQESLMHLHKCVTLDPQNDLYRTNLNKIQKMVQEAPH